MTYTFLPLLSSAAPGTGDVVGPASSVDNSVVRFDGVTGKLIQGSNAIISDAGDLTGLANIIMGNVTWSAAGDYISSTATMSVTATNDCNFTSGTANINFIAFNGAVNIVSDLDCTFGSVSGAFIFNAGTSIDLTYGTNVTFTGGGLISAASVGSGFTQWNVDNLRLDGNTLSSTSGNMILSPTTNILQVSYLTSGSVVFVGTSGKLEQSNATLNFDSTNNRLAVGTDATTHTIVVGGASIGSTFKVEENLASDFYTQSIHKHTNTSGFSPNIAMVRSRGSSGAETVVTTNDYLGRLIALGHDGTDYALSSQIEFLVANTVSANIVPGKIIFRTANTSGTLTAALTINEAQNVSFTNSITIGETTLSSNLLSSINNLDVVGDVDLNLTATTNNLNLLAGTGIGLTAAGGIFLNNDTNFGANAVHGANNIYLGASNDAVMFRDGTSLVLNPRLVGSVGVNDVVIGSSSASGGNDSNLRVFRMALFGSDILGTAAVNLVTTGALRAALNFVLTMNSGTVGAPFSCNLIDTSTGNNFIMANVFEYTLKTNSHTTTDATKASVLNISTGIDSTITLSPVGAAENHMLTCLKLVPNGKGVGGAHSNGASTLNIYSTGLFQKKMTAFSGTATYTYVGGYFGDDLCMEQNSKIIFDNTETDSTTWVKVTKGTYYLSYSSTNTALEYFAAGTKVLSQTSTLNTSEVVLRTLSGASTSYARVGGTINVNTTAVGNVGTGEDDLITYTMPANTLSTNGDRIDFKMSGKFAANANNKQVKVKFGATTLLATGALAFNNVDWSAEGYVIRTGATTQKAACWFRAGATLTSFTDDTAPAETLSGTVVLKCTGEATSNNDITEESHVVMWHPNA